MNTKLQEALILQEQAKMEQQIYRNVLQQQQLQSLQLRNQLAAQKMQEDLTAGQLLADTRLGGRTHDDILLDLLQGSIIPEVATKDILLRGGAQSATLPLPVNPGIPESEMQRRIAEYNFIVQYPGLANLVNKDILDAMLMEEAARLS